MIFVSILHVKKKKNAKAVLETSKNIEEPERTVTLLRATDNFFVYVCVDIMYMYMCYVHVRFSE